ncbi:MAG TPA: hypothetical protein VHM19_19760, partial [Polyangiales bacterium]|nr:hypothetical protein [Polyangiales bacterium]
MSKPACFFSVVLAVLALSLCDCKSDSAHARADAGGNGNSLDAGHMPQDAAVDARTPHDSGSEDSGSAADDASAADSCKLTHGLQFGHAGGFINSQTLADLSKAGVLTISYSVNGPSPKNSSCTPPLPKCGTAGKIDVGDIVADLMNADVEDAFAATDSPSYGGASGPSFPGNPDTGLMLVVRDDGKQFDVAGGDCVDPDASQCTPTPSGITKLAHDLDDME